MAYENDPYIDPKLGILKNLISAPTKEALIAVERNNSCLQIFELQRAPLPKTFDLWQLQRIHHALFSDIYKWAGCLRTVSISKGNTQFCFPEFIKPEAEKLFSKLADEENLKGLPRNKFVERMAYYLGETNMLHPFREGNGRTQRVFFEQLARSNGYRLSWENCLAKEMIAASIAAEDLNYKPLEAIIDKGLSECSLRREQD